MVIIYHVIRADLLLLCRILNKSLYGEFILRMLFFIYPVISDNTGCMTGDLGLYDGAVWAIYNDH